MDRLQSRYPDVPSIVVLINREDELLLLLDNRHVKFEKTNLAFLNQFKLETTCLKDIRPTVVAKIVFPHYDELYSDDILTISDDGDYYTVSVHPSSPIHFGSFKLHKKV